MKTTIAVEAFLAAILFGPPQVAATAAAAVSIDQVEQCFQQESKLERFVDLEPKRKECFGLATALTKRDQSIQARALYSKAVNHVCSPDCPARMTADFDEHYRSLIPKLDRNADQPSLNALFESVDSIAYGTLNPAHARALTKIYEDLERRNLATPEQTLDLYKVLVDQRQIDQARSLIARHPNPEAQPIPDIEVPKPIPESAPKGYALSPDGKKAQLIPIKRDSAAQVVVVISCHFSDDAISAIEKDAGLRSILEEHALILTPQQELHDSSNIVDWNKKHPSLKALVTYKESEWPQLKEWDTPHFYFLNHGRVVSDFRGWWEPEDEPRKQLTDGLRLIGLLKK